MEDTQDIFAQPEKPKGPKHFKTPPEEPAVNAAASAAPQEPRAAAPEPDFSGLDIVVEEGGQSADGLATDALERFTFDADLIATGVSVVLVTVLNYILSKLLVFRKKKTEEN